MQFKPQNPADHQRLLASAVVRPVKVARPKVFRHVPSRDTYGEDENGEFITGFLPLQLGENPAYLINKGGLGEFFSKARRGALGLLSVLGNPIVGAIASRRGWDLQPAHMVATALSQESDEDKFLALIDIYGSDTLKAWATELESVSGEE